MPIPTAQVVSLSNRLATLASLRKFDSGDEREADRIAYGISDIVEAAENLHRKVDNLLAVGSRDEVELALIDIFEELNHISFHLHDMRSFKEFDRSTLQSQ
jgi:hypothetical protein